MSDCTFFVIVIFCRTQDEHGQSLLHFACARSHGPNGLSQLIDESGVSITYRDELYRTARDVSYQASQPTNATEIDRWVLGFAAAGDVDYFEHLLLEGYDHIRDLEDEHGLTIGQIAAQRNHSDLVRFLDGIEEFEETREQLHRAIRQNKAEQVIQILQRPDAARLVRAKNYYGRSAMHLAVLRGNEDMVDRISTQFRPTLRIGDNVSDRELVLQILSLVSISIRCVCSTAGPDATALCDGCVERGGAQSHPDQERCEASAERSEGAPAQLLLHEQGGHQSAEGGGGGSRWRARTADVALGCN